MGNIDNLPFKVNGEIKLIAVSQRQMSAALGLSTTRINELVNEKVLIRDESRVDGRLMLYDSLQNYFLSRKTTGDGVNFWNERALHEKVKREMSELKLGQARGELIPAKEMLDSLTALFKVISQKLQAIPSKMGRQLSGKDELEIKRLLSEEIGYALEELGNYDVGELKTDVAIYDED